MYIKAIETSRARLTPRVHNSSASCETPTSGRRVREVTPTGTVANSGSGKRGRKAANGDAPCSNTSTVSTPVGSSNKRGRRGSHMLAKDSATKVSNDSVNSLKDTPKGMTQYWMSAAGLN